MQSIKLAVVGTDTDVGKTVLSLLIMQQLYAAGKTPFYIKPFQTGCESPRDPGCDAAFVYQHTAELMESDPSPSVINCYRTPKAPFFAARDMGETVEVEGTLAAISRMEAAYSHLVIEAAGGLLVPVTSTLTMVDFLERTGARPVIAARAGLGTINHTLLTIQLLESRGIAPAGIVFMDGEESPTPEEMIRENMEAVESFSGMEVSGVIGRIDNFNSPDPKYLETVKTLLEKAGL